MLDSVAGCLSAICQESVAAGLPGRGRSSVSGYRKGFTFVSEHPGSFRGRLSRSGRVPELPGQSQESQGDGTLVPWLDACTLQGSIRRSPMHATRWPWQPTPGSLRGSRALLWGTHPGLVAPALHAAGLAQSPLCQAGLRAASRAAIAFFGRHQSPPVKLSPCRLV